MEKKAEPKDASKLRVGIVVADFNRDITGALLQGARETLREWKVRDKNIVVRHVPGSFEIPFGCAQLLSGKNKPNAIIAIGCILKGETKHDEYIGSAVSHGIMQIMLKHAVPISFGVLTPNTLEQARARSHGDANHGKSAAAAALQMALGV